MNIEKCPLSNEEKQRMVAEAAFLESEKREGPADPVADWLSAEAQINDALDASCRSAPSQEESSAYRRMRAELHRMLEKAGENVNADTVKSALARTASDLRQVGEFFPETIDRVSSSITKEINETVEKLGYNWQNFRIRQNDLFAHWKERSGERLNRTTRSFNRWIDRWRSKNDH